MIAQLQYQLIGLVARLTRSSARGPQTSVLVTHAAQITQLVLLHLFCRSLHVVAKLWIVRHPCQKTFLVPSESSSFALLLIRKMRSSLQHLRRSAQPTLSVQLWVSPANAAPPLKMVFSWIAAMVPPRTEMINALAISVALMEALAHRHHKPLLKVVAPKSKHVNCLSGM